MAMILEEVERVTDELVVLDHELGYRYRDGETRHKFLGLSASQRHVIAVLKIYLSVETFDGAEDFACRGVRHQRIFAAECTSDVCPVACASIKQINHLIKKARICEPVFKFICR